MAIRRGRRLDRFPSCSGEIVATVDGFVSSNVGQVIDLSIFEREQEQACLSEPFCSTRDGAEESS
jgi:hypothetical protein